MPKERLKTLKQIIGEWMVSVGDDSPIVALQKMLKQESIKWVKEDIENYRTANLFPKDKNSPIDWRKVHNFIVSQRQKWKNRFNITEGELKTREDKKQI